MSRIKTHVKKGDNVEVIAGSHKGKQGTVLSVNGEKSVAIVEGVRILKKATARSEANPEGGILDKDGPIHISNLKKIG